MHKFGGYATNKFSEGMHEVKMYKDAGGIVRAMFRRHCMSSTWVPEGAGYPVFDRLPTGQSALKELKSDAAWHKTKVMHDITRHFPFLHR